MKKFFEKLNLTPKQIIYIILLTLLLIFIVQNVDNIKVSFFYSSFELPLIIIIVVAFSIGFITSKFIPKKQIKEKIEDKNKAEKNDIIEVE